MSSPIDMPRHTAEQYRTEAEQIVGKIKRAYEATPQEDRETWCFCEAEADLAEILGALPTYALHALQSAVRAGDIDGASYLPQVGSGRQACILGTLAMAVSSKTVRDLELAMKSNVKPGTRWNVEAVLGLPPPPLVTSKFDGHSMPTGVRPAEFFNKWIKVGDIPHTNRYSERLDAFLSELALSNPDVYAEKQPARIEISISAPAGVGGTAITALVFEALQRHDLLPALEDETTDAYGRNFEPRECEPIVKNVQDGIVEVVVRRQQRARGE